MINNVNEACIISDLHLGANNCQSKQIVSFLKDIELGNIKTKELILNGDVFDSLDFKRLKKHHWKILSHIRKISPIIKTTWITGNHDDFNEIISHLIGVEVLDEYIIVSNEKKILILHGHIFDNFIDDHPLITLIADMFYNLLQKKSVWLAKKVKKTSKIFLRCSNKIMKKAKLYCIKKKCDIVCCGHTHLEVENGNYFNSGCWTELPGTYLTINSGTVKINHYKVEEKMVVKE